MAKELEGYGNSRGPMWLDSDGLPRMRRLYRKSVQGKAPRKKQKA